MVAPRRSWDAIVVALLFAAVAAIVWLDRRSDAAVPGDSQSGTETIIAAGDIASCYWDEDEATAALLDRLPGTVLMLGNGAYQDGSKSEYEECYGPTWGRHLDRTRAVPGNQDYRSAGAAPFFDYFGDAAGTAGKGWYAWQLGAWRLYGLDSDCRDEACQGDPGQIRWLEKDLAAFPTYCVLAYWHQPRFSSGQYGGDRDLTGIWRVLYDAEADVVLNAHDHIYERFAPQDPEGRLDAAHGLREFVVGTGGAKHHRFEEIAPNSEVRHNRSHGVLEMQLSAGSYTWRFHATDVEGFEDSGSGTCQ